MWQSGPLGYLLAAKELFMEETQIQHGLIMVMTMKACTKLSVSSASMAITARADFVVLFSESAVSQPASQVCFLQPNEKG